MKLNSTPAHVTSAPALARGIALLRHLEALPAQSLEDLARATQVPKASLLRLLRTLLACGLVAHDPLQRRWSAMVRLVPVGDPEELLRLRHAAHLDELCTATGQIAELYLVEGATMRMIDRRESTEAEIRLRAGIGFVRHGDEFESLAQLLLWHGQAEIGAHWCYHDRGRQTLGKDRVRQELERARVRGYTQDLEANAAGVRRQAVALLDGRGQLLGGLALACLGPAIAERQLAKSAQLLKRMVPSPSPSPSAAAAASAELPQLRRKPRGHP